MNIATLFAARCELGEAAFWHPERGACCWVDILGSVLYEYHPLTSTLSQWSMPGNVSFIAQSTPDHLILGVSGGLLRFNLATGEHTRLATFEQDLPTHRCNDGGCDPQGRIWIGTMDKDCKDHAGGLYRIDLDSTVTLVLPNLTIPNGIAWSLDHQRMYFIDTPTQQVRAYFFNNDTGQIQFERTVITVPATMGMPDGMAIDTDGMLWIALYNGACVTRWDPATGALLLRIELPALHITNCAFIGDNLDSLLVTSAKEGMTPEQLEAYPGSGNVFIISGLPARGVPVNKAQI